jgi:peroxiredoxin
MARESPVMLDNGDVFPDINFPTVSGENIILPGDFSNRWVIFLIYRGHW